MLTLAVCAGGVLLACLVLTLALLFPFKERHTAPPLDLPFERLTFRTPNGARLAGWFLPQPLSQGRTVIVIHGICSNKSRFVSCARELMGRGFSVLLLDLRGHGESSRGITTYGHLEREDVGHVAEQLALRADVDPNRIALMGHSLGAAIALLTLAHPRIKAVVADSAFTDMQAMLRHRSRQFRLPLWLFTPTRHLVRLLGRFDLHEVSPKNTVQSHDKPVLLVHGTGDRSIPYSHALQISEGAPHVQLWTAPDVGHLQAARLDGYFDTVGQFLSSQLAA